VDFGFEGDAAGIGIPASAISVQYQSFPVSDSVPKIRLPNWFPTVSAFLAFQYGNNRMPDSGITNFDDR
jgi:hypothetical protein